MDELQSVVRERQLREERRSSRERMDRGADVVHEAGLGQLCRAGPSAERLRPLHDEHRAARACHRDRRGQAVRARPDDDGVRHRREARSQRPGAPRNAAAGPRRGARSRTAASCSPRSRPRQAGAATGRGGSRPASTALVLRIEAVALGQEVGQRARIGVDGLAARAVADEKRSPVTATPAALVLQPAGATLPASRRGRTGACRRTAPPRLRDRSRHRG